MANQILYIGFCENGVLAREKKKKEEKKPPKLRASAVGQIFKDLRADESHGTKHPVLWIYLGADAVEMEG